MVGSQQSRNLQAWCGNGAHFSALQRGRQQRRQNFVSGFHSISRKGATRSVYFGIWSRISGGRSMKRKWWFLSPKREWRPIADTQFLRQCYAEGVLARETIVCYSLEGSDSYEVAQPHQLLCHHSRRRRRYGLTCINMCRAVLNHSEMATGGGTVIITAVVTMAVSDVSGPLRSAC